MAEPAFRREVVFGTPPLTFNRDEALRFTGIAPKLFAALEAGRQITGRHYGRNGEKRYLREQLEQVTLRLFGEGGAMNDIDSEFAGLSVGEG